MNRIDKIGVELEGGWNNPKVQLAGDGSVNVEGSHVGEIQTPPFRYPLEKEKMIKFITDNYPDFVNETCGFHIHVSMKSELDYSRLMEREFYDHFVKEIKKWAKDMKIKEGHYFWSRLEGQNQYCKNEWKPQPQSLTMGKDSNRYTFINYCYNLHHTLECRLFPMFKSVSISCAAIDVLISIINGWLEKNSVQEKTLKCHMRFSDLDGCTIKEDEGEPKEKVEDF